RLQERDLLGLGLLDLDDEVGLLEDGGRVGNDRRPLLGVGLVGDRRSLARAALHDHRVPRLGQLARARGRQRHPVLVGLDLRRDADAHQRALAARTVRYAVAADVAVAARTGAGISADATTTMTKATDCTTIPSASPGIGSPNTMMPPAMQQMFAAVPVIAMI